MARTLFQRALVATSVATLALGLALPSPAGADANRTPTQPSRGAALPQTVSADALPTVQVDGVVWAQVTVGTTVYATGSFAYARPAGTPASTSSKVARANLLAYDITTGNLITSFAHTLNAQGRALTVSPDGHTLYVGGNFTSVDGASHKHLAAFDLSTGNLISTFSPILNNVVLALTATNSIVYVGGNFTSANGTNRSKLAAFDTTGALTTWKPTVDGSVTALIVAPNQSRIVVAGGFDTLDGAYEVGIGTVTPTTGGLLSWPSDFPVQDGSTASSVTSLSTDGTTVFATAYSYQSGGNFEGRFAFNPTTGAVTWLSDCHGDSYSAYPIGGILYSASHEHDCSDIGAFPQATLNLGPARKNPIAAETTAATGTISPLLFGGGGPDPYYTDFTGFSAPTQLNWYPKMAIGTVTGQNQAAWSVTGNANYVSFGGEFPSVNGVAQAGLVRFAVRSIAPNKVKPAALETPVASSLASGAIRISWPATSDPDDTTLSYSLYRDGGTSAIYTTSADSQYWNTPALGYVDTGLAVGSGHTYIVKATDPSGNVVTSDVSARVTVGSASSGAYATAVMADAPNSFWRLAQTGTSEADYAGSNPLNINSAASSGAIGPFSKDTSTGVAFSGTLKTVGGNNSNGTPPSSSSFSYAASTGTVAPASTFSLEAWVKTTSTSGGLVVGEGLYRSGDSSAIVDGFVQDGATDRVIYLDNSGKPNFGVTAGGVPNSIAGSTAINDGAWHLIDATLGTAGATLYVDGVLVASDSSVVDDARWNGYWRVGGDNLVNWPSNPDTGFLKASIADVAVYPVALTTARVGAHYTAGRKLF